MHLFIYINKKRKDPHTKFLMVVVSESCDYEVSLSIVSNSLRYLKFLYGAIITFTIRKNIKIPIL